MKTNELVEKFKSTERVLKNLAAQTAAPLRKALFDEFVAALDRAPEVAAYKWAQYTDYFNDGEPCTFSVHDLRYLTTGKPKVCRNYRCASRKAPINGAFCSECGQKAPEDEEWDSEYPASKTPGSPPEPDTLPEAMMLQMFGDHAEIIIRRGETDFEVSECDHD